MSRNIKNKVTGSIVNITTYDANTGEITGFSPVGNINLGPVDNVHILGGFSGQFLSTDGNGNLSWATANGGNGNGTAIVNGLSSVTIPTVSGNVITTINGTAALTVSGVQTAVQGNLVPATTLSYNLGSPTNQWKDLYLSGNTLFLANIPVSISGNVLTVNGHEVATADTPITGDIDVTGNVNATALNVVEANLGTVANLTILGGFNGQFLRTDGTGNLSWATGASNASPGGTNTQVQFNDAGTFGADTNFTFNKASDTLSVTRLQGNLVTASQPNVTSLGILTGLTSQGLVNFNNTTNVSLGQVSNLKIQGGSTGQVLTTYGNGTLYWGTGGGGSPDRLDNGNSNVVVEANSNVTVSVGGTANVLTVTSTGANVTGTATVTGNVSAGNATITSNVQAGNVTATANVSAANVVATANVTANNVSATANVSAGNVTAGNVTVTANVTTANLVANSIKLNNTTVRLGNGAGGIGAGIDLIAIGNYAAAQGGGNAAIAIGSNAGYYGANVVGDDTIAIGNWAGYWDQDSYAIAIGQAAGAYYQDSEAIAIGRFAGFGENGNAASGQGNSAIAIGQRAGSLSQGNFSIAIGANAGRNVSASQGQPVNSIVLNATGIDLVLNTPNSFVVKPVRSADAPSVMFYNSSTGEITQTGNGNITAANVYANAGTVQGNFVVALANVNAGNVIATANVQAVSANFTGNSNVANLGANYLLVGNGLVTGNWTVQGNLVTTNQSSLQVQDPTIALGVQPNGKPYTTSDGLDRGILMETVGSNIFNTVILAQGSPNNRVQLNITPDPQPVGNSFIGRQVWAANAGNGALIFPLGTTVTAWDALEYTITVSNNWLITPYPGDQLIIGSDRIEFQGYLQSANLFVVASNVINSNNSISVVEYGNFQANSITVANVTANGNIVANANVTANNTVFGVRGNFTGNVTAANLTANALVEAPNANITTLLTALDANVTGNLVVTGNTTTKDINTTTGNITTVRITATGNVQAQELLVLGQANVQGNTNVQGNIGVTGDANLSANLSVGNNVTVTGNANLQANAAVGVDLTVGNTVTVTGNANLQANLAVALELAGNTANFNQLQIAGNVTVTSNGIVTLGNIGNVKIGGGNTGQSLRTYGNGTLYWASGGQGAPGGVNTSIQFNDDDSFGGDTLFTYDKLTGNVNLTGNVQGTDLFVNPGFPSGPNVTVKGIINTLPGYVAEEEQNWFLANQSANATQLMTIDGVYVVDGTLYDYYDVNGNTEITGNLLVTDDLTVGGNVNFTGSFGNLTVANLTSTGRVTKSVYNPGEVIRMIALQQTGFNQSNTVAVGAGVTTIANYNYTPVSTNSRIRVDYSAFYVFSGASPSDSDSFASYIYANSGNAQGNVAVIERRQGTSASNVGGRTGTIFPITASILNTSGNVLRIAVAGARILGDDLCTVYNNTQFQATFYITEIQN